MDDPLHLAPLFEGGEEWLPVLKPVIERQPSAPMYIGPDRGSGIVPVRELTFQALKPNPPAGWKVVAFGQNPYPRVESATGIAMFDNTFGKWSDSQFGKVPSIRCIIKAACISKHGIDFKTPIADMRKLLADRNTVQPPEWFSAMLAQGVLLLNASLTASADKALSTDQHTAFWRPVAEKIVEAILEAKQSAEPAQRGVVFAWWGAHARALKSVVQSLQRRFPSVPVRHLDHCNPAAQGDLFCKGDHFGDINRALRDLSAEEIDWLPAVGWDAGRADTERMGAFIERTRELHKGYLDRLQEVRDEGVELPPLEGVLSGPMPTFSAAAAPVLRILPSLEANVGQAAVFARMSVTSGRAVGLTEDEVAAFYLYTTESPFYRRLNVALRDADRKAVEPYRPYLRLFFSAVARLEGQRPSLYRGVAMDLSPRYPVGREVTWWGVSSCTTSLEVARQFLGTKGKRTLFEIVPLRAFGIRPFSAFTEEEEYVLPPGTRLKVTDVVAEKGGLCTIRLEEQAGARMVS